MADTAKYLWENLLKKFEFQSYGHSLEILRNAFPEEWDNLQDCLDQRSISIEDLRTAG